MATITVENKGFNSVSGSADKALLVGGAQVAELFSGSVTVSSLSEDQSTQLEGQGVPIIGHRVCWTWAVKHLVSKNKLHLYLSPK